MKKCVGLRANTYNCLTDDNDRSKKANSAQKGVIKRKLIWEHNKNCLDAIQLENSIIHVNNNKINVKTIVKSMEKSQETQNNIKITTRI